MTIFHAIVLGLAVAQPESVDIRTSALECVLSAKTNYNVEAVRLRGSRRPVLTSNWGFAPDKAVRVERHQRLEEDGSKAYVTISRDADFVYEKHVTAYKGESILKISHKKTYESGKLAEKAVRWQPLHAFTFDEALDRYVAGKARGTQSGELGTPGQPTVYYLQNWVCAYDSVTQEGVLIVFPRRWGYQYHLRREPRTLFFHDAANWRFCDGFAPGATLEHECWLAAYDGGDSAELANRCTRRILDLEAGNTHLKYLFPYHHRGFRDSSHAVAEVPSLLAWTQDPGNLVYPDSLPGDRTVRPVAISAARGEREPVQIALRPNRPMVEVSVTASDLVGPRGKITSARVDVKSVAFFKVRKSGLDEFEAVLGDALRKKGRLKWTPDVDVAEIQGGNESIGLCNLRYYGRALAMGEIPDVLYSADALDLAPHRNQPVFVTIRVPRNAPAGDYTGSIEIRERGKRLAAVPVRLHVWGFALPERPSLMTMFQLWGGAKRDHLRSFYKNIADHRGGMCSLFRWAHPVVKMVDGRVQVDFSAFDEWMTICIDELGAGPIKLPHTKVGGGHRNLRPFCGFLPGSDEYAEAVRQYLRQVRAHLIEKRWIDDVVIYIFDEPDEERVEVVRKVAPIFRQELPEVKIYSASCHVQPLLDAVDLLCPGFGYYDAPCRYYNLIKHPQRVAEVLAEGKELCWYNQSHDELGVQPVALRMMPWISYKYGVTGYFIWSINRGFVRYPHQTLGMANYLYAGRDGPIDSVRWEMVREGLEDYEYAVLLERAIQRVRRTDAARKGQEALAAFKSFVIDSHKLEVDTTQVQNIRERMARAIEALP